jgi:hypothetical protein
MASIREELEQKLARFEELERRLVDPDVASDSRKAATIAREHGTLAKLATKYRRFKQLSQELAGLDAMISSPAAVAGHRMLCTPQLCGSPLPQLFWEAGPKRVQSDFAGLLERRVASGELQINDVPRAASQFFSLLKGEPHARLVFGCCAANTAAETAAHLAATVELFLRAYATTAPPAGRAPQ